MSLYLPGDAREALPGEIEYPLDVVERTVAVTLTQRVLVTVTVKGDITDDEATRLAKRVMTIDHGTIGHPTHPTTRPKVDAVRFVADLRNLEVMRGLPSADITPGADEQPFVQLEGWADGEDHIEVVEEVTRQDRDEMAEHDAADDWHDARCER